MGAWDHTTFGNDNACDWGGDLASYTDLSLVEETLDHVINAGDNYLEAPESCRAIAAAEVIARLQGKLGYQNAYTKSIDKWITNHPLPVPPEMARKAHAALDRILRSPSELPELWQESENFESWQASITELKNRIHT